MFNSELFEKLVSIHSPSGDEENIRDIIKKEIEDYVDSIEIDRLGNLIAKIEGTGPKIMVAAHMDQIGLMVTKIEDEGYLRFTNIGGINPYNILHQRFVFKDGLIGIVSKNGKADMKNLKLSDMFLDIGVKDKNEAEKKVSIGDMCTYLSKYQEDEQRIISACVDNRIGCYMAIEAIKSLKDQKSENELYIVFTVQEELGLRGATTAAFGIEPDIGIAVDVTGSGDTPDDEAFAIKLGNGAAIKVKDRGIVVDPKMKNYMIDLAKEKNIDYQLEILEYGATDSAAMQLSKAGVLAGVISVPTRYIHSPVETIYKKDLDQSLKLLVELLRDENIKELI
ncbi:MAG: M42 family metallopeptidase [Andreesenia angusta]|nr:M42 family metallopeptidase [Andreesenia angusta]